MLVLFIRSVFLHCGGGGFQLILSSSKSILFPSPLSSDLSCALFYHALSCSDKAVCSFYWCERHPVVISSAVDCYWFMHANVRFRFTCNAAVKEVMFDKTVNFLTDTIRGALPAESKGNGTAGTKPAVPRSASQPGNHVKRGSDMPIILGSHGCFRLFSFLIGCLTVTESFRDIFIECFSILSSFHRRFFWQTWALDYSLSNISHKVLLNDVNSCAVFQDGINGVYHQWMLRILRPFRQVLKNSPFPQMERMKDRTKTYVSGPTTSISTFWPHISFISLKPFKFVLRGTHSHAIPN